MKRILIMMLIFTGFILALTLDLSTSKINETNGLVLANTLSDEAMLDSMNAGLTLHFAKTSVHDYADGATTVPTAGSANNLRNAITDANAYRTALVAHLASDSCHCGAAETSTTIPSAISTNATAEAYNTYINALNAAMTTHRAVTSTVKMPIMYAEIRNQFAAHIAIADTLHTVADLTHTPAAVDTTNIATYAAKLNLIKDQFNAHHHSDSLHIAVDVAVADSMQLADLDETSPKVQDVINFENELKRVYNKHLANDSIHVGGAVDEENLVTRDDLSLGGHIIADATTFTSRRHDNYRIPPNTDRITVQFAGTSISTGASFRCYGSIDPYSYGWVYIDSTATLTSDGFKHYNTNLYPYMKWYMSKRTDGTWKIGVTGQEDK